MSLVGVSSISASHAERRSAAIDDATYRLNASVAMMFERPIEALIKMAVPTSPCWRLTERVAALAVLS
jgi:hypothetical protein